MAALCETILLASGLSVLKPKSFSRQVRLLKKFLQEAGRNVILTGRAPEGAQVPGDVQRSAASRPGARGDSLPPSATAVFDLPSYSTQAIRKLTRESGVRQIILLGYPDQFEFLLDGTRVPAYFWYQCSKPAVPAGLVSTVVVPLTEATTAHLEKAGFTQTRPVIPHGVDTQVFRPATIPMSSAGGLQSGTYKRLPNEPLQDPVLVSVGANSRRKRFDKLIETFALVAEELPEARLTIKTDKKNKPGGFNLIELARSHGVVHRVSIIDRELTEAELASFYVSADIYVHTAEWEGFCIPVIEAMACGLPVVTHPVQGPGELIPYPELLVHGSTIVKESQTALLIADPRSYADTIVRLAENPTLAHSASIAGRSAAVSRFDIRVVTRMWNRLLNVP